MSTGEDMDPKEYFKDISKRFPTLILGGMHIPSDMKKIEADFRKHLGHFVIQVGEPNKLWCNLVYGAPVADAAVNMATFFPSTEDATATIPHIKEGAILYEGYVGFSSPRIEPKVHEINEEFIAQYLLNPPSSNKAFPHCF